MNRRLVSGGLAALVLAGMITAGFSAGQSEALVSLSYLNGTFWDDLKATVKQETDKNTNALYQEIANQAGQGAESGFAARSGVNGDRVSGSTGSGLIWSGGSAVVSSGVLVDATVGAEVAAGGALSAGHRYLAGTDVVLAVASGQAQWMVEGEWTVAHGDPVQEPLPFADVAPEDWYYGDVLFVYREKLFNGDSPTSFAPKNSMERRMMTTVLHRLAGEPAVGYSALFRDVPDGEWYTAGTIWAGSVGVVSGVEPGVFAPMSNVTRQEIAVILYRYAERMGYDVSVSASLAGFRDQGDVASWGARAMSWAVGAGILNGSDGALLPGGDASRAQVAAMLHRFIDWSQRQ